MKTLQGLIFSLLVLALTSLAMGADSEYTTMRLNFAAQPGYNPYVIQSIEKAKINEAMAAWRKGDVVTAFKEFKAILEVNPVSIETHRRMADGYKNLVKDAKNEQQKQELLQLENKHLTIAEGLIKSIISSGDGKSSKTAFKVISIPEEYMALWYLGLIAEKAELDKTGPFDVISAKNKEGNVEKVYFDVSILKNSFSNK